jgi:hypothetical protein
MNIVIVGGGISGLYTAYKLYKKYDDITITIYERNNYLGGRIHTIERVNKVKRGSKLIYDAGAGIFTNKNIILLNLIKSLNIEDQVIELPKSDNIYIKNNIKTSFDISGFISNLLVVTKTIPIKILKSKTLLLLMKELFTGSDVDDFMYAFGYCNEFECGNAYDILETLKNYNDIKTYTFKNGMSTITDALLEVLKLKKTIFKLSHDILDIESVVDKSIKITYLNNNKVNRNIYNKLFVCITKNDLLNIPGFLKDKELQITLDSIITKPLNRIYAQFPVEKEDKVWFSDISSKVLTNNAIRSIIPINKDTGLIMISYGDSLDAETWNYYKNVKDLERDVMKYIRLMFPDRLISNPIWIKNFYWKNGTHWPAPYYKEYKNKNKNNYYIVGETMSRKFNAWIEGALLSVENLFKNVI